MILWKFQSLFFIFNENGFGRIYSEKFIFSLPVRFYTEIENRENTVLGYKKG